jgi:hypothetical protein
MALKPDGSLDFGSPWFKYLNDFVATGRKEIFHYIDIFYYGSGADNPVRGITLVESEEGREEAEEFVGPDERFILVQPLTSEAKKNWSLEGFETALSLNQSLTQNLTTVIIGAPSERETLEPFVRRCQEQGLRAKLAICTLPGAFSLLKRCELLITGDTSIKHLACAAKTKIIELSLGPSFYQKTGAYLAGSIIIQSRYHCTPCPHRTPCPYPTNLCAKSIPAEAVGLVASKVLNGQRGDLRILAHEYSQEINILQTEVSANGDWLAYSLSESFDEASIAYWLDRASWKMLLNKEYKRHVAAYGSESLDIGRLLKKIFPEQSGGEWKGRLSHLEDNFDRFERRLEGFLDEMRRVLRSLDDPGRLENFTEQLVLFGQRLKKSPYFSSYVAVLEQALEGDGTSEFGRVRRLRESLSEMHTRAGIQLKLLRSLQNQLMEIT